MTDTIRDERQIVVTKNLETNNNRHPNLNVNLKKPTPINPPPQDVKPDRLQISLSLSLSAPIQTSSGRGGGIIQWTQNPKPISDSMPTLTHARTHTHRVN